MIATLAPTSSVPAPVRSSDVFDFLHSAKSTLSPEDYITVEQSETPDLVHVRCNTPDGRSIRRAVPAQRWQEKSYRGALIEDMWAMVA